MNITANTTAAPAGVSEKFRYEVAAGMGSIGLISTVASFIIICLIVKFKLYRQLHTRLVLYLCISDFLQGLAGVSSLGWIHRPPQFGESLCIFQAVMFQIGDIGSAAASFFICLYVWANINFLTYPWIKTPGKIFERITVVTVFSSAVGLCIIGEIRGAVAGFPIYTPVGFKAWCWIHERYSLERLMIHYTWIILICFLLFVIYIHIMITLCRSGADSLSGKSEHDKKKRLAKKMIGFPIVYFCAFIPLCCERVISFATAGAVKVPLAYVAFAVCMFVVNGLGNALLYGYTRRLFKKMVDSYTDDTEATLETR